MEQYKDRLNRSLVELFNDVLKAEELALGNEYDNLSLKEFHVIEAVCIQLEKDGDNTTAAIAAALRITAGTLTVAVNTLEKKGYLVRRKIDKDKRVVRIYPTEKGSQVNAFHKEFHMKMVNGILEAVKEEELPVLLRALEAARGFFHNQYKTEK